MTLILSWYEWPRLCAKLIVTGAILGKATTSFFIFFFLLSIQLKQSVSVVFRPDDKYLNNASSILFPGDFSKLLCYIHYISYFDSFLYSIWRPWIVGCIKVGEKEGVDQCGFTQPRLSWKYTKHRELYSLVPGKVWSTVTVLPMNNVIWCHKAQESMTCLFLVIVEAYKVLSVCVFLVLLAT